MNNKINARLAGIHFLQKLSFSIDSSFGDDYHGISPFQTEPFETYTFLGENQPSKWSSMLPSIVLTQCHFPFELYIWVISEENLKGTVKKKLKHFSNLLNCTYVIKMVTMGTPIL